MPVFWIIAGINGAGKTTFTQKADVSRLIGPVPVLNADDRTLKSLRRQGFAGFADADPGRLRAAFIQAATEVESEVRRRLALRESVGVESVISRDKFKNEVMAANTGGYLTGMIYVGLASVEVAIRRVANRVAKGGHHVPEDSIRRRWGRSLDNLAWFAARVDRLLVFDNTNATPGEEVVLVASGKRGVIDIHVPAAIPEITHRLLEIGGTYSGPIKGHSRLQGAEPP